MEFPAAVPWGGGGVVFHEVFSSSTVGVFHEVLGSSTVGGGR